MTTSPDTLRRLRVPGYFILVLTALIPLVDLLSAIWPLHPGTVMWRFGAVGLLSGGLGAPILMLFTILVFALFVGDRKVVLTVAIVSAILAILLLLFAGAFTLDALQMKGRVNPQAMDKFKAASGIAFVKLLVMSLASVILALSAFRASRVARKEAVARAPRSGATLVVGSAGVPRANVERTETPSTAPATDPKI